LNREQGILNKEYVDRERILGKERERGNFEQETRHCEE